MKDLLIPGMIYIGLIFLLFSEVSIVFAWAGLVFLAIPAILILGLLFLIVFWF